ncbi:MAG: prepilin-type N-terminal cleavage/methylation domain-containing protein, partial [Candidatus Riflebacteria bacterium]
MKRKNSGQNGFTLVEVIVAAAIFSIFITSVFAFYRMGSRMFTSGSWKQQKQKDSEMFLNLIRERASRAS